MRRQDVRHVRALQGQVGGHLHCQVRGCRADYKGVGSGGGVALHTRADGEVSRLTAGALGERAVRCGARVFHPRYTGNGWLALGVSPDGTMDNHAKGSDIVACSAGGKVLRYWVTDHNAPTGGVEVRAEVGNASHSTRSAALSS